MPLYEYKCDQCGDIFEVMQKFADEPLTVHEKCGGTVERLISAPALQFKGSGFYITDYGKSGNAKPAENGSPQKSESSTGKSSGSSDSAASSTAASTPATESKSKSTESKSSSSDSKPSSSASK